MQSLLRRGVLQLLAIPAVSLPNMAAAITPSSSPAMATIDQRIAGSAIAARRLAVQKLLAGASAGGGIHAVMASGAPAVTISATGPGAPYETAWPRTAGLADAQSAVQLFGGFPTLAGGTRILPRVVTTTPAAAVSGIDPAGFGYGTVRVAYRTDAAISYVQLYGGKPGTPLARIRVDGRYASLTPLDAAAASTNFIRIDFTSAGSGWHDIEVEFVGNVGFVDILTQAKDSVRPPGYSGVRAIVVGDSYVQGPNLGQFSTPPPYGPFQGDNWVRLFGDALNIRDIWQSGIGGTGIINGKGDQPGLIGRMYDMVNMLPDGVTWRSDWRPDVIIIGFTLINDISANETPAQVTAALQTEYVYVRARLPNVPILVGGAAYRVSGGPANFAAAQAMDDGVRAWVAGVGDPVLQFVPITPSKAYPQDQDWITGSGNSCAPAGDGNADLNIACDSNHPSYAGHEYWARQWVRGYRQALLAMQAALGGPISARP